jgi:hypothetical protein
MDKWGELSMLRTLGEALADAKEVRKANYNRWNKGLADFDRERGYALLVKPAEEIEARYAKLLLEEFARVVPDHVRQFGAETFGFGDGVLFARLIAYIGHPRIAVPHYWEDGEKEPVAYEPYERTISELWAYCGCGDPALSGCYGYSVRTREERLALGKRSTARAVLRAWSDIIVRNAEPGKKGYPKSEAAAESHYFQWFTWAKAEGLKKRHQRQCQNRRRPGTTIGYPGCGIQAHPEWGEPGSLWRPGHAQAHAHRIVHKEFLRDLWIECGD